MVNGQLKWFETDYYYTKCPVKKLLTLFIIAIKRENDDKSCVFVLA